MKMRLVQLSYAVVLGALLLCGVAPAQQAPENVSIGVKPGGPTSGTVGQELVMTIEGLATLPIAFTQNDSFLQFDISVGAFSGDVSASATTPMTSCSFAGGVITVRREGMTTTPIAAQSPAIGCRVGFTADQAQEVAISGSNCVHQNVVNDGGNISCGFEAPFDTGFDLTFTGGAPMPASSVPLDRWSSLLVALMIALTAAWGIRRTR